MSANPKNPESNLLKPDSPKPADPTSAPAPQIFQQLGVPTHEALQALLAFSSLHEQIRQRRIDDKHDEKHAEKHDRVVPTGDVWELEQFVLDEVLQLVSDRALAITGADGVAIALADGNAIVCRASSGTIAPDAGVRLDPNSGFSGACLTSGHIVRCDDSENDSRVNVETCRRLGTRSMVAVPLSARQTVIGLLEAFSSEAYGFNDSDVRNLNLLAELILAALKPEEEDRLAEISQRVVAAVAKPMEPLPVADPPSEATPAPVVIVPQVAEIEKNETDQTEAPEIHQENPEILAAIPELSIARPATPATPSSAVPDLVLSKVVVTEIDAPESVVPVIKSEPVQPAPSADAAPASLSAPHRVTETLTDHNIVPDETPAIFSESSSGEKSRYGLRIVLPILLIVLVALFGLWRTIVHTPAAISQPGHSASAVATPSPGTSSPSELDYSEAAPLADKSSPAEKGQKSAVTGIRHWSAADSSTVVIDLQDQVQYEAHRLANPERIYFDLHDTTLAAGLDNKSIAVQDALLVRVRVAQPVSGITRVVLETKNPSDYSVSLEQNPYRLVVEVRRLGAKPQPHARVDLFGPENPKETIQIETGQIHTGQSAKSLPPSVPAASATAKSTAANITDSSQASAHVPQFRLVLDAGHGGWDLGTVGRKGLLEKDLVLDIVDRLGKLVQSHLGAEVIYTRQDDTYIPLEKRAEIANVAHADLFLSIHANYSDYPSARGVETYYTNTYSSLKARTPGADATDTTLQNIDWTNVDIREKVQESHRFAASVQRSLFGTLAAKNPGLRDRGVKAASYVVLTGTEMPAILAEVSFVSSPTDESELQRSAYRQQIAEALYQGIAHYAEASHHVKLASAKK